MTQSLHFISSIMIYQGHVQKADHVSSSYFLDEINEFFESLKKSNSRLSVSRILGEHIIKTIQAIPSNELSTFLLVIPASNSSTLDTTFSTDDIGTLQQATQCGLNIYTVCGSAYWLARKRIWNGSEKEGKVNMYSGTALGPLSSCKDESNNVVFAHEAVKVRCKETESVVLNSGGGTFMYTPEESKKDSVKILATYNPADLSRLNKRPEWSPAIISCSYGLGKVILSMVHLECNGEDIDDETLSTFFPYRTKNWKKIKDAIGPKNERINFITAILNEAFTLPHSLEEDFL